jgi:hypothetical protein
MDERTSTINNLKSIKIVSEFTNKSRDKIAESLEDRSKEFFISPVLSEYIYCSTRSLDIGDYYGTVNKKALFEHAVNKNSDLFNYDQIMEKLPEEQGGFERYLTYRSAGVFLNHQSSDPEAAIGLVFDSTLILEPYEDMHAVILMGIDKKKAPNVARSLMTYPERVGTSMGCTIQSSVCTACGRRIFSEADFCNCLKFSRGGRKNGRKVAELLEKMSFYEQSIVTNPAAPKSMVIDAIHGAGLLPGALLKIASTELGTKPDALFNVTASIYNAIKNSTSLQEKKRLSHQLDVVIDKLTRMVK